MAIDGCSPFLPVQSSEPRLTRESILHTPSPTVGMLGVPRPTGGGRGRPVCQQPCRVQESHWVITWSTGRRACPVLLLGHVPRSPSAPEPDLIGRLSSALRLLVDEHSPGLCSGLQDLGTLKHTGRDFGVTEAEYPLSGALYAVQCLISGARRSPRHPDGGERGHPGSRFERSAFDAAQFRTGDLRSSPATGALIGPQRWSGQM